MGSDGRRCSGAYPGSEAPDILAPPGTVSSVRRAPSATGIGLTAAGERPAPACRSNRAMLGGIVV